MACDCISKGKTKGKDSCPIHTKESGFLTGLGFAVLLVVLASAFLLTGCSSSDVTGRTVSVDSGKGQTEGLDAGTVRIPVSELSTQIKKFSYGNVRYFAVLGSDGAVRTAFDACDVCGGRKGYSQQGVDVVCNNCGRYFSIDSLGTTNKGRGCWPSFLEHRIEDGYVVISEADLAAGNFMFN